MVFCLLAGPGSGWGQQYLYAPQAVVAEDKVQKRDGVLVQELSVKKGDTLYGISRTFSGRGSYYPQILLFNDLKDPNKIYPGNVLRIPVTRSGVAGQAATGPAVVVPASAFKKKDTVGKKGSGTRSKAAIPATGTAKTLKQPPAAVAATPEQRLYERAIKAYRQDDYRTALELFDRFLADHPSSALAADASLYKAECYLKQSNQ